MKIALLSRNRKLYSSRRIIEAAEERGHEVALLARADPAFLRELEGEESLDFWTVAQRLAGEGHVAPLATVGSVGQVTPGSWQ